MQRLESNNFRGRFFEIALEYPEVLDLVDQRL